MFSEHFLFYRKIGKNLEKHLGKQGTTLNIGCGQDRYRKFIHGKVINLDIKQTKAADIIADANQLKFKPNSFDNVISIFSFYYLKNPFSMSRDISKILKKDGKFILVLPFLYPIHDIPEDRYRFTSFGIKTVLEKYFNIESIKPIGSIFSMPSVLQYSLVKGIQSLFPKNRPLKLIISTITYPLFLIFKFSQILSLFDIFDRSGRFPIAYFVVAIKK